jgi:primosomal protein N' (replication factor Y)
MFAELVINIEAPLQETFHYHVPPDLREQLRVGHLVEVEFGSRLAQGIVVGFDDEAPVEDTKPVIGMIDEEPVVRPWQIAAARWMSAHYLTPLNACLRLMLPPGLTRWADIRVDVNPRWNREGRLTERQEQVIALLDEKKVLRGRQLWYALGKKKEWQPVVDQLLRRDILRRGSVLEPPRVKPKQVRNVSLIAGYERQLAAAGRLGRASKASDVLVYLLGSPDPMPPLATVLLETGATEKHVNQLEAGGLLWRSPAETFVVPASEQVMGDFDCEPYLRELPQAVATFTGPLEKLLDAGCVRLEEQPAAVGLALPRRAMLAELLALRGGAKYTAVLQLLAREGRPVPLSDVLATGISRSQLQRLAKLDLVQFGAEEVWRDPLADRDFVPADPPQLTPDQAQVWGELQAVLDADAAPQKPVLLHGVTGSGKTEIYMRAIEKALNRGQQAIMLVPEIALTPQTVRRFAARFPGRVAVMHSGLSDGQRYDTWRRARQGLFDIVVGPRSALFTPFANLGVIVLDEEHDASYKQTPPVPAPYYHARDVAEAIGRQTGALVILGSATPEVTTYHAALSGRYQILELPKRIMGHRQRVAGQAERLHVNSRYENAGGDPDEALAIPLPPVHIVDLRQELRVGNRSIFSRALDTAVTETLERGEQAILFLNRRGTASFVICRDCGHTLACPRCDLPLTYHRPGMMLICHQCGHREPPHELCPQCGSKRIKHFGLGTEEVEAQVRLRWPTARVTRWDSDTTAGKDRHEELLARFVNQESDILIGTQMIAKGLDLPLVTLVGVISADVALGLPDFHTGERTFQVLAQVAGRAGRGLLGGRVIVQTYQPEHYAISNAAEHDYAGFFVEEIAFRTQLQLPPFRRLAKLEVADPVAGRGQRAAEELAAALRQAALERRLSATEITGPVPPYFSRVDGRFRWQILIRAHDPLRLLADFPIPRNWVVDIDPVSTL